jgi:predicted RNA-binding Zn ribbon-like protein
LLAWFSGRGLVSDRTRLPSHAQVHQVITMREGLRDLARCNRDLDVEPDPVALAGLNEAAAGVSLRLAFSSERVVLSPRGDGALDGAMAVLLSVALQAMVDGRWRRLKTCPGEQCGWVFYDHSRNNSGRWCSMAVCGGRTKAKSHYRRQRLRAAGEG